MKELGLNLPTAPQPFGTYAEAVQTGNLLVLTGMLPRKDTGRNSLGASAQSSKCKRGARRLTLRP